MSAHMSLKSFQFKFQLMVFYHMIYVVWIFYSFYSFYVYVMYKEQESNMECFVSDFDAL